MKEKKTKTKPVYNMWQITGWMLQLSQEKVKSVPWICLVLAVLAVVQNVIGLYIAPMVLGKVEAHAPLQEMLLTIGVFTALVVLTAGIYDYIDRNAMIGRIEVRTEVIACINRKRGYTSYPNREDVELEKKMQKAMMTTNSNRAAAEAIWTTWTGILQNILGFLLYLCIMASLDGVVLLVTVVTSAAGYLITNRSSRWAYEHREEEAEYTRPMSYATSTASRPSFAKEIRIFGMSSWLNDVYASAHRLYCDFIARGQRHYLWADLADVVLTFLRNGFAYGYLIHMVLTQGLPASEFLLYFTAIGGFAAWVNGILSGFSRLYQQALELSVVREYLDTPEPFVFEEGIALEPKKDQPYSLEFRDVSFRYPGAEKDTIRHLNLTIRPGEKLAIVGANGAGKTTMVKLLCGLYDPTEGQILLNGEDIRKYNRRDYYRHFSAVFQECVPLQMTVADNVAQDYENIDQDKVKECIEKAGLTEKVESLPKGYDTPLGRFVYEDGIELSGGETQRLMLAKALYKDAPLLVLDEPTAALDPLAENDIYMKYSEMTKGHTSVYISHRLASTRFCDRIIYIENGTITEEGTHESLLAAEGAYAQMFEIQRRYYREEGTQDE